MCKESAEQGNAEKQYKLGTYYQDGIGTEPSPQKAFECFKKAAEQGNAKAQNKLGECYKKGNGTPQNKDNALRCFIYSARQGNAEGQYNFGEYLQVEFQPLEWFKKSAAQGNTDALYKLGECYENGELVKADTEKAREFYNQAAEQGHKLAKEALERLNKTEISVSQK